jgi:hypothetical protein
MPLLGWKWAAQLARRAHLDSNLARQLLRQTAQRARLARQNHAVGSCEGLRCSFRHLRRIAASQ